jgi:hypothetical protein
MDNGIATPNKSPTDRKDLVKFARREGFSYNYLISVFHTIFSISFDRRPNVTAPHKVFPALDNVKTVLDKRGGHSRDLCRILAKRGICEHLAPWLLKDWECYGNIWQAFK